MQRNTRVKLSSTEQIEARLWRIFARNLSPEEWVKRLDTIDNKVARLHAGGVIAWDFLADTPGWKVFQDMGFLHVALNQMTDRDTLIGALVTVGYPQALANARVSKQIFEMI